MPSDFHLDFEDPVDLSADVLSDAAEKVARQEAERAEEIHRSAILGTDWRETAVVRVVEHHPEPAVVEDREAIISESSTEYDVERYEDRAPPLAAHHRDGRCCSVTTLTWPLLERLAEDHEEMAELVDAAIGPVQ